jgi:3-deoxy-D-manno-octulosonic-acid transferase
MESRMAYLLNAVYVVLLIVTAPWFIFQALARGKYRQGFAAKFLGAVPIRHSNRPCIWFHAVSVGEINLLGVALKAASRHRPDVECVISTTTMTGYALARQKYAHHPIFYCPLDFTWAVRRAMRRIRPSLLVLAELELWPNLIRAAREANARVAIINGRLSERSFRGYQRIRRLLQPVLTQIDAIAAQNDRYAKRFIRLGAPTDRVHVTGSLKFDGASLDRDNPLTDRLRKLAGIAADDIIFLAGSTQAPEEQLAVDAFRALTEKHPRLRLIIVPRHPHRFDEVAALLDQSSLAWQRRSALSSNHQSAFLTPHSSRILLVDTIGELGGWWGTATIGFVGGSLFSSRGGQNMIEPAAYGVAVSFGPNTQNFRDVVEMLLSNRAAVRVNSGSELTGFVRRCLEDHGYAAALGANAAAVVKAQQGATERTWKLLEPLLPPVQSETAIRNQAA